MAQTYSANVLLSMFRREKANSAMTRVIGDFPKDLVAGIVQNIQQDEMPLFLSFADDDEWLMTTDKSVIHHNLQRTFAMKLEDVVSAKTDFTMETSVGVNRKDQFTFIRISDRGGAEVLVRVEAGSGYWAILNVLASVAGRNSRQLQSDRHI